MKKILLLFILCPMFLFGQIQIGQDINGAIIGNNAYRIVNLNGDGKILAVGSPSDDGDEESTGVVRVYKNEFGQWIKIGEDINGSFKGDKFGNSISLNTDGTTIAVGIPNNDTTGLDSGQVQIYKNVNNNWIQIGDNINGENQYDFLGSSVSLSSDGYTLAIGIPKSDENGNSSGQVKVFKNVNDIWTQIGGNINGEGIFGLSGSSVSLSSDGNTLAVGAPEDEENQIFSGQVRVYKNINNVWTQIGNDINGSIFTFLGSSVSLSGDANTLVVKNSDKVKVFYLDNDKWNLINDINVNSRVYSNVLTTTVSVNFDGTILAYGEGGNDKNGEFSGVVKIYKKNTFSSYTQIGTDIYGIMSNDYSGISISLNDAGDKIAIGGKSNSTNGILSDDVRIFENINNIWTEIGNINEGNLDGSSIGNSVVLSSDGNVMAIGTSKSDINGIQSGKVNIYRNINGVWTQIGSDIEGEAAGDSFGISLSLSSDGNLVAIGATGDNTANGDLSGSVKIYRNINNSWIQVGSTINGKHTTNFYGKSVSLNSDGTVLVVGSISIEVDIYQNINDNWVKISSEIKTNDPRENFGETVSLNSDGTVIAIGAIGSNFSNDPLGRFVGKVYIYKNKDGNWIQIGSSINGKNELEEFGRSVSLSEDGTILAIGGNGDGIDGQLTGVVRIYKNESDNWIQIGEDIVGDNAKDYFGTSVKLSDNGKIVAIGATNHYFGEITGSGYVKIYQNINDTWQFQSKIEGQTYGDNFGNSISLNAQGNIIAISVPFKDGITFDIGQVRVYDLTSVLSTEKKNLEEEFYIYPNPATNQINIQLNNSFLQQVSIFNNLGQLVKISEKAIINTSNLSKGIYFIKVKTNKGEVTEKLVIN